jgi:hypothetical protein
VLPPADEAAVPYSSDGYISWHRDIGNGGTNESWPFPSTRAIKVSIFLYDVPEDGGGFSVHRRLQYPRPVSIPTWHRPVSGALLARRRCAAGC